MRMGEFIELDEGINDKGILKVVFMAGLPGAGKSTISAKITDGTVSPRIVNTDKSYEFLLKKYGQKSTNAAWALLGPASKQINASSLAHYINGMLPMFVDGSSANADALGRRVGILKSFGYDYSMVWIDIEYETALERIQQRTRDVDLDFIQEVYSTIARNKEHYQHLFGNDFTIVDNNDNNFAAAESAVYTKATSFFSSGVANPVGQEIIAALRENADKNLVPSICSEEDIKAAVGKWYTP